MMKCSETNRHFHFSCWVLATESSIWEHDGHKGSHLAVKLLAYLLILVEFM